MTEPSPQARRLLAKAVAARGSAWRDAAASLAAANWGNAWTDAALVAIDEALRVGPDDDDDEGP